MSERHGPPAATRPAGGPRRQQSSAITGHRRALTPRVDATTYMIPYYERVVAHPEFPDAVCGSYHCSLLRLPYGFSAPDEKA